MRRILATAVAAVAILALAASATPNFSTCSALKAIPGNANGVSDSQCAACAKGAQTWYPCDTDGLCYCSANGGTIPPQYRLPFSGCTKAIAVVGNPNGVKDADCLQCSNGAYRYYPCDQPGTLCTCAPGYGTVVTTPSPPTTATPPTPAPPKTPAPPPSPAQTPSPPRTPAPPPTSLTDAPPTAPPAGVTPQSAVNKLSDLQQPYAPFCASLSKSGASATTCSQSYNQALCNSMLFYMAQSGGNVARGLDWRGTCFMNDVWKGRNLTLGWFDAGDYVKFGLPMAFSATALAWGALLWPAGYTSTPMTKDALLYNLRVAGFYFYNAWDANTQTLVAQIGDGTADHSSWYPCKVRTTEARIMQTISPSCPGTEVAADTASALAAIALALQKFEGTASSTLQNQFATAALQLWNFANGANKGTYTNCVPGAKTFYDSWSGYKDELAFAGTWIHELAQKGLIASSSTYLSAAQSYYSAPGNLNWDNKMLGASLRLYAITGSATYKNHIQGRVAVYTTSGPRTAGGLISGINTWGALREAANAAFVARYAADLGLDSGNAALLLAKRQLDYILGKNPAGRSYMVGFGANSPINAHHRSAHDSPTGSISNPTNNRHTIYGALVGGPPSSDTDYYDDRNNYQTNEVATDYNALFTGLIASFASWTPPSGVDATTTCSATSKGAPPAPPGPALAPGSFTITAVALQSWYLQVKIKPKTGVQSVVITYNDGNGQCTGTGPQWPDNSDGSAQWTCSVTGSPVGTGAIAVKVSTSSGSLTKVIKEGGVALALQVSQSVAEFSSPDFVQTVAEATNVTDVSRISVTGLTAVDASNSLVNFTIDPLPFPAYTVKGEAYISNDGTVAQSTFGTDQTTTSVYSSFQIGADGQPNASSTVMQTLQTGAGVVQGTVIIINNPTYIYYAAPPKEESFATSPVGAALGGACATLIFFGGLLGGYKYAKRNKGKKQPQTVIVVVGQEGLQRALMGQEMAAASASTEPKSVECDGQIV